MWVSRPHNAATWPGCLDATRTQFDRFVARLESRVAVRRTEDSHIATDDAWVRDYGPLFVREGTGLAGHDFRFDGWGGLYAPYDHDDAAAARIAGLLDVPITSHAIVLEGGSIESNGLGTVLTTDLHGARNPGMDRETVSRLFLEAFGATNLVWLEGGLRGDDTAGHVDNLARFVGPRTIAAPRADDSHPDHALLERNWQALQQARDQDRDPFDLIALPMPGPLHYDFPPDEEYDVARDRLPASYANFLISNGALFLPAFGDRADDQARLVLEPTPYEIVPIPADRLIVGLGGLHCLTMQVPET